MKLKRSDPKEQSHLTVPPVPLTFLLGIGEAGWVKENKHFSREFLGSSMITNIDELAYMGKTIIQAEKSRIFWLAKLVYRSSRYPSRNPQ
jgi:hypothetical protein